LEPPCGISSLLPIGMSCRGRAEAFARRLQSRLRTLGVQVSVLINFLLKFLSINIPYIRKPLYNDRFWSFFDWSL
jgi:hypothetical protein